MTKFQDIVDDLKIDNVEDLPLTPFRANNKITEHDHTSHDIKKPIHIIVSKQSIDYLLFSKGVSKENLQLFISFLI